MTTEEYFKNLASKLELKDSERGNISDKHTALRESLKEKLEVEDDFLTGSYNRNTMIRPKGEDKFDVDFFLAFNKDNYGESELPELLKVVKDTLDEIKDDDEDIEEIREQKRSIGVIYNANFQIDVVPAVQIEKDKCYKIFDKRTQKAVESNPKLHGQNLTTANEATESGSVKRLVPIVKLLKSWRREKCDYMKSFHLEMLVVEILKAQEIKSFSEGIAKFFTNAKDYLQEACLKDPANDENIIDLYLDEDQTREELLELITDEKQIAENALRLEEEEKNDNAVSEWKKIFTSDSERRNAVDETSQLLPSFALGDYSHCKPLRWQYENLYKIRVDGFLYSLNGYNRFRGINSDARIKSELAIKYIAKTNAPHPYEVFWQVVNTGEHAKKENGLRGNFFKAKTLKNTISKNALVNWEISRYTGKHWIECFIVKNNICMTRSGRFYVNIKNPNF